MKKPLLALLLALASFAASAQAMEEKLEMTRPKRRENPNTPAVQLERAGNRFTIGGIALLLGAAVAVLGNQGKESNPTATRIGAGVGAVGVGFFIVGGGNLIHAGEDLRRELQKRPVR